MKKLLVIFTTLALLTACDKPSGAPQEVKVIKDGVCYEIQTYSYTSEECYTARDAAKRAIILEAFMRQKYLESKNK